MQVKKKNKAFYLRKLEARPLHPVIKSSMGVCFEKGQRCWTGYIEAVILSVPSISLARNAQPADGVFSVHALSPLILYMNYVIAVFTLPKSFSTCLHS